MPTLVTTTTAYHAGAFTMAPTAIHAFLSQLQDLNQMTDEFFYLVQQFDELPSINWVDGTGQPWRLHDQHQSAVRPQALSISLETLQFWNDNIPSDAERRVFT